ncbi:MAG: cellulase family glycosylhydrolase [Spirochaetota bacterium]
MKSIARTMVIVLVAISTLACASSPGGDEAAAVQAGGESAAANGAGGERETSAQAPPYGQLRVEGTRLLAEDGSPVQLKGMSTMGLQWYGGIVNERAFTALARDWEADVVRLALYVGEGGYATDPSLKQLVVEGVELAIDLGMYVIIDWHVLTPGDPNAPVYDGVDDFFAEMSERFGDYPNVIYEIMNEPNGDLSWQDDLKPYAERIVSVIRANDPDNVILIGSGTWSQDVDVAAADPVDGENLMYTLHFYTGTHGEELREKARTALDRGVALFASEWGTSAATGTGGPFINAAEEWLGFLDEHRISWTNWSLCNKNETSAALNGLVQEYVAGEGTVVVQEETPLEPDSASPEGHPAWDPDQLTVSGAYVRAKIKGVPIPTYEVPIASWDFEDGLGPWHVADDSGARPELGTAEAESSALTFRIDWPDEVPDDAWSTAPRLRVADTGLDISTATAVRADLYLEAGQTVAGPIEVNPVLQYPPSWWSQLPAIELDYESGEAVGGGWLKYGVRAPVSVPADTTLAHLLLVIVGAGSGYEGRVAVDNVAVVAESNGDAAGRAVEEAAAGETVDPGEFVGLPWDFEDATRQGWVVTEDSPAKVALEIGQAETTTLAFDYGWSIPGPDDPWSAAPRISSSFVELEADAYETLTLDLYLEEGAATTGRIEVQPVIQSPQHGYWFQLNSVGVSPLDGDPVGDGLLKYSIEVPLTSNTGEELERGAVMRNLILITVGAGTDYQGRIHYDNISFN